jgi:hypothetical protein
MINRKGTIVYSFEELKELKPINSNCGFWTLHANFHAGHQRCAEAAQQCDCVVGMLFNNMAEGEKLLTGTTFLKTYPISQSDIEALQKYSDICVILKDDYQPIKEYLKEIKDEFFEQFPTECLAEKGILEDQVSFNSLFYAVAFRYILHEVYGIFFDYQAQCGKDRYRTVGYLDYIYERWGVKVDLLDPVLDDLGNVISKTIGGLPKQLKNRIDKKLILPEFKTIEEVKSNIKDIEGLKVLNFYRMNGWVHATFMFDDYRPWVEGIRCK